MLRLIRLSLWLSVCAAPAGAQTTWYVDAAVCPTPGSGTALAPFCRIQHGIVAATAGDTVLVLPGRYVENLDFLGKAITVRSTLGAGATIVDGGLAGPCVSFANGEGSGSVIQGFTLTNGSGRSFSGGEGGGVSCVSTSPTILENRIIRNATQWGGGIACNGAGSPLIARNVIAYNSAPSSGGGVFVYRNSSPRLENNLIYRNSAAGGSGGGLYVGTSSPTLESNTIFANSVGGNGGGIFSYQSFTSLVSCIVWGNAPNQLWTVSSVTYSDVEGGWGGTGNLNADPLFVDGTTDDFHLQFGSPCRGTGSATGPLTDFEGDARSTPDIGADEFGTHFYYAGEPRPWRRVDLRFTGAPGTASVFALLGSGFFDPALPVPPFGDFFLVPPFYTAPMPAIGANGTASFSVLLPGPVPFTLFLQALVGSELTNPLAISVR